MDQEFLKGYSVVSALHSSLEASDRLNLLLHILLRFHGCFVTVRISDLLQCSEQVVPCTKELTTLMKHIFHLGFPLKHIEKSAEIDEFL